MRTDPCKILGVEPGADKKQVTAAYRKRAKKWHPDVNASSRAKTKWDEISWAYDILINDKEIPLVAQPPGIEHTFVSIFTTPPRVEIPIPGPMPEGARIRIPLDGLERDIVFSIAAAPGDVLVCSDDQDLLLLVLVDAS